MQARKGKKGESEGLSGTRLRRLLASSLLVSLAGLAFALPQALADTYVRNYESQISGLVKPMGIGIDPFDNVWVTDPGNAGLISEFAPYPSLTKLSEQDGGGHFSLSTRGFGNAVIDGVNGDLYVAEPASAKIFVFDPVNFVEEWLIGGGISWIAADNSGGSSNGELYVATSGTGALQAFKPGHVVAPFSCATCSGYLTKNRITGTPSGSFGTKSFAGVATDSHGNIYVSVTGGPVQGVDEFKPSGEFVRNFPMANAGEVAVDPTNDHLLVTSERGGFSEYSSSGEFLDHATEGPAGHSIGGGGIAVNSTGHLYVAAPGGALDIFSPAFLLPKIAYEPVSPLQRNSATLHATVSPNGGDPIVSCHFEYGTTTAYSLGSLPCSPDPAANPPASNFTADTPLTAQLPNLTTETTYHYRLIVANDKGTQVGEDRQLTTPTAVNGLSTEAATAITNHLATLHGSFTAEEGLSTEYWFEYGTSVEYGHEVPLPAGTVPAPASGTETEHLESPIEGLLPGTTYHFRLVAKNSTGLSFGSDQTLATDQPPAIEGLSSSTVTATSAVLHARINPHGLPSGTEAQCSFEYGPTTSYGSTVPCPTLLSGTAPTSVEVHVDGLQPGVTYHFRVLASNRWGSASSEDQTFEFFPPSCPNSAARQQTSSTYLPDCRAYELVSPPDANGTIFFTGGPNTGQATSPSRLSFIGAFSSPPGSDDVIGTAGDLYVATRSSGGWQTSYVGPSGDQAACVGESPNDPWSRQTATPVKIQEHVLTDPSMSRFVDFAEGTAVSCLTNQNGIGDGSGPITLPSTLGHLWAADGSSLGTLPSGLSETQLSALKCPNSPHGSGAYQTWGVCRGDVAASADLTHFFFSSNLLNYTPGGSTAEPGGAYDYDVATGSLTRISSLAAGGEISPGSAGDLPTGLESSPFIHFAAVSGDGSHVLMTNAVRSAICGKRPCARFTDNPLHLYMSVAGAPALAVSESQLTHEDLAVHYLGMTPDGSKVYFTSEEHLTAEDPGHLGASLYMWEAAKAIHGEDPLTLISKANPGSPAAAGDTGNCHPAEEWTTACSVSVYSPNHSYDEASAGLGGNGLSDSPIAANGDIYFYSPEQLDGDRGIPGEQNLYDYRQGQLQFVTSFHVEDTCPPAQRPNSSGRTRVNGSCATNTSTCLRQGFVYFDPTTPLSGDESVACSEGPIARLEISPDDSHMAFVSAGRVTSYDNVDARGSCRPGAFGEPSLETHCTEMYSYSPVTGSILCDSCNPSGEPPTSDVYASQDGLFMTDDGRTFFSTEEALVPADTNNGLDVYEYADGRPRLITPGTGTAGSHKAESLVASEQTPGLIGASANGTDVYFSTFDVLASEDHNGNFLKFYDARTNGGFPQPPLAQPCAAAEECHGPGTEAPRLPTAASAAELAGGNLTPLRHHRRKHHKKTTHKRHRRRAAKHNRRAAQ